MKIAKNYRLDEQLTRDMEIVADQQNRSVTNLIETVMKDYCTTMIKYGKKSIAATSGKEGGVKKKK